MQAQDDRLWLMKTTKNKNIPVKKGPEATSTSNIFTRFPYIIIAIVGFLLYAHTLKFDYTNMDDKTLIADDKAFISKLSSIPEAFHLDVFKEKGGTFYRPLFVTSLIIDGSLGKMSFAVYHFSNILFHVVAGSLLFSLLIKLGIKRESALLRCLFLIIHPALVQAVAWIPGRNDSLLAIFVLSSLIMLMNFIKSQKSIHFVLHSLFFLMALFTKETAIILPILYLLMIKFWSEGKLVSKANINYLVLWITSIIILFIARSHAIQTSKGATPIEFLSNIPNNLAAFFLYFGKILLPFNLSVIPTIADGTIIYGLITIAIIAAVFLLSKTKFSSLAIFGGCWFILFIIPILLVPKESAFFYEQRLYLPLMGILIVFCQLILSATKQTVKYFNNSLLVLIICFTPINFLHSKNFSGKINFWNNALATSPNSVYVNKIAASVYYKDNNLEKAEELNLIALKLNPAEPFVNNDLGIIFQDKKEWEKAIACFQKEIAISPTSDKSYYNLAYSYYSMHNLEVSEKYFEKTITLNPEYKEAYQSLALVNADLKNFERARYYTAEAQKRGIVPPKEFLEYIQK